MSLSFGFPSRLAAFLLPFYTLSYPTDRPPSTDSFHNSNYFTTGPLDVCIVVTCIATMAVLRDAFRLLLLEPFARWKLSKNAARRHARQASEKANGESNGYALYTNGHTPEKLKADRRRLHRRVLRFAEQGWSMIYYTIQWSFGLVCGLFLLV